jgi:hypothetical protein
MCNGIMLQCLWLPHTPAPQSIWMGGAGLRGAGAAAKNADSGSFDFDVPFGADAADVSLRGVKTRTWREGREALPWNKTF